MASPGAPDPAALPQQPEARLVTAASMVLLATAVLNWEGYEFGTRNHSIQIPLVKSLLAPDLYPLDPIRASFGGFATFFYHGVAGLARLLGELEATYFVLYFATLVAFVSGAYCLGRVASGRVAGVLTAALFVSDFRSLAGESSHWSGLTHTEATSALLIWALVFHLGGRRLLSWALVGVAFDLHALAALYVAVMLFADGVARSRERGWGELIRGGALFALLASPVLAWIAISGWNDPIASVPRWLEIMRERSSLHAFPFSTDPATYARYALLLSLGWLGLRVAPESTLRRHFPAFALAIASMCAIGIVFAEWIPVPLVIRAQLLRSTRWLTYLSMVLVAGLVVERWSRGFGERVAACLAVAGVVLREPTWLAIALAFWSIRARDTWGRGPVLAAGAALAAAGVTGAIQPPEGLGLTVAAVHFRRLLAGPAPWVCAALYLLMRGAARSALSRTVAVTAWVVCLGWLAPQIYARHHSSTWQDSWKGVQDWAREHTPPETVFLTPPEESGFRVFSERATVAEWKDGTQQFFSNAFADEWWQRMHALGGRGDAYHRMGRRRLIDVGRRYGARYVVFWAGKPLVLPRVFETRDFVVYELRELTPGERDRLPR
jgi:hypothetical protein